MFSELSARNYVGDEADGKYDARRLESSALRSHGGHVVNAKSAKCFRS